MTENFTKYIEIPGQILIDEFGRFLEEELKIIIDSLQLC